MKEFFVWDWPVRLLHWLMVLLFSALIVSGKWEIAIECHIYLGYALSAVILARLLYGVLGSKYARFIDFPLRPKQIFSYLTSIVKGNKQVYMGHNPLGALMVVVLLATLLVQTLSGLVNSDEVFWFGPFYDWVSSDWQAILSSWHRVLPDVLLLLVALHIMAILLYEFGFRESLLSSMLTGEKQCTTNQKQYEDSHISENSDFRGATTSGFKDATNKRVKTPRVGVVISLVCALCWLLWLYSLPI